MAEQGNSVDAEVVGLACLNQGIRRIANKAGSR